MRDPCPGCDDALSLDEPVVSFADRTWHRGCLDNVNAELFESWLQQMDTLEQEVSP